MILVTNAPGGLWLSRDDRADAPLYVKTEELAALLADLLTHATDADDATAWDAYVAFCGNEAAAVH